MEVLLLVRKYLQSALTKAVIAPLGPYLRIISFDFCVESATFRLDPSIRVTYHPRSKKTIQSCFYNKTTTHTYTQRIAVFNTKVTHIKGLEVTDQFPISGDPTIKVSPALVYAFSDLGSREKQVEKVKVSAGIFSQWSGADEPDSNEEMLGEDGKFDWICSIPSQKKVDLFLRYDVTAPPRTDIIGL